VTFYTALKWSSFTHSAVYAVLLVVWLTPGLHGAEFVFGLTHGLMWIGLSLAALAALRLRVITLRLAVAIIVLGGVGPFFGTAEFIRESRARVQATWP
jgi:type IV secretory pathway VirB6-like protein